MSQKPIPPGGRPAMRRALSERQRRLLEVALDHPEHFHRYVTTGLEVSWRAGPSPRDRVEVTETEGCTLASQGFIRLMPRDNAPSGAAPYMIGDAPSGLHAYVTEAGAVAIGRAPRPDILAEVARRRARRDELIAEGRKDG